MQQKKVLMIISAMLFALFALTVLIPTDASSAVRTKTASSSVKKSSKNSIAKAPSKKSKRKYARRSTRRSRKSCNTTAGVKQAIELVRTQSVGLCKMTGLEYVSTGSLIDSVRTSVAEDVGELDDPESGTDHSSNPNNATIAAAEDNASVGAKMSPEDAADHAQELLEQEAEDDVIVGEESFKSLWLSYVDGGSPELTEAGVEKQKLIDTIMKWLGTRYHFGGTSATGIDCSAFVREVYYVNGGISLPRTASEQSTVGVPIRSIDNLRFGDLIFFNTRRRVRVGHVGIYLGDNLFAHASSRFGVTISSLESTYYNKRFIGARRLDERSMAALVVAEVPSDAAIQDSGMQTRLHN